MPTGCNRRALLEVPRPRLSSAAAHETLPSAAPHSELAIAARTSESPADPAYLLDPDGTLWRSARTPEGPGTLCIAASGAPLLEVYAWGEGAAWMLRHVPHWLGRNDAAAASFEPSEELRAALGRSTAGEVSPLTWRLGSSRTPYETLLPIVVAQRVTGKEAGQAYRRLVRRYGTPGPGPAPTWIAPDPNTLRHIDLDKLTAMGIDAQRGRTLHAVARAHRHLEALPDLPRDQAYQRLLRISGVGPWSAAKLMLCACGDADAVWIGDAHLPDLVAWNLRAEARADDERLLNILEPYRGHRARVARLLELRGHSKPRFGARHSVQRYR